jgi:hypothetical protein
MKHIFTLFCTCMSVAGAFLSAQTNTPCASGAVNAPALPVSTTCTNTTGSTAGATTQTNAANGGTPTCGSMGQDVWYSFVAPASGAVTITTSPGSITDGVMALYSGSCGAWTQMACSDDANGLMPVITQSGLTAGATYLVRFWEYGGGSGTFNICVQSVSISNPGNNGSCATPSPICSGSPISFVANEGGPNASTVNPGNNYDCLSTSPNPSWYYLEIDQAGNLVIDITAGEDVDYEIWGPFTNLANAQANCGSYGVPQDCSYSPSEIEQAVVSNVSVGQVYVLLVTNYANTVQIININEAAANTASTNCGIVPLPVGYVHWDLQYIDRQVVLSWATETEENNEQFIVQRSGNGFVWETIGAVAGNGSSQEAHSYQYIDDKPLTGTSYYRLMQVDFNGTPSYTSILSVNTNKTDRLTVYPNPAKNKFSVLGSSKSVEELIVTNPVGKSFPVSWSESKDGLDVDCSWLAPGIYTLTIISNGAAQSERLMIEE